MHLLPHAAEPQPRASLLSVVLIIAASALLALVIEPHVKPAAVPHMHHVIATSGR